MSIKPITRGRRRPNTSAACHDGSSAVQGLAAGECNGSNHSTMQHAPTVLINGRPKANRRATPRVSVTRGRWHRPALSPRSRGWAAVRGLHDQASARGEVKDTPPRCSASQDPMMNMGSRGIIAAVLDNDSDSDTEASKGRNLH